VLLGLLFIASPWVMGFDTIDQMAMTAWVVGGVTAISGLWALPWVSNKMHHTPIPH
jgi:predicted exporter